MTKLEERRRRRAAAVNVVALSTLPTCLSTPIDGFLNPRRPHMAKSARKSTVKRKETPEQKAAKTAVRTTKAAAEKRGKPPRPTAEALAEADYGHCRFAVRQLDRVDEASIQ
jgi:hypothetical protein